MTADLTPYLQYLAEHGASRATIVQYRSKLRQFLEWAPDPPSPTVLYDYRHYLLEIGRRPRTMMVVYCALLAYHRWAAEQGIVPFALIPRKQFPRLDEPIRLVPTTAQVEQMYRGIDRLPDHTLRAQFGKHRMLCVLALLENCGLRRSELLGLEMRDFDTARAPWWVRIRVAKGEETRRLPVNSKLQVRLETWIRTREAWCADRGCETHKAFLPVDRVRRLSDNGLAAMWREILLLSGLKDAGFTPHSMRHLFACRATKAPGASLQAVSKLLGHADMGTTFKYLRSFDADLPGIVEGL